MRSWRRQGITIKILIAHKRADVESRGTCCCIREGSGYLPRQLIIGNIKVFQSLQQSNLARNGSRELITMQVEEIEVNASAKLNRDGSREKIIGDIEVSEVSKVTNIVGQGLRELVGRQVERLEVRAVGNGGRDGA